MKVTMEQNSNLPYEKEMKLNLLFYCTSSSECELPTIAYLTNDKSYKWNVSGTLTYQTVKLFPQKLA